MTGRKRDTIVDYADAFARGSGLYYLTMVDGVRQPRLLRWTSLTFLIALPISYGLTIGLFGGLRKSDAAWLLAAFPLFLIASGAAMLRLYGPRLIDAPDNPLDEREGAIKARAGAYSGHVMTLIALSGCYYLGVAELMGWWMPRGTGQWVYLGMMLQGVSAVLPVFFASWLQPALPTDGDSADCTGA